MSDTLGDGGLDFLVEDKGPTGIPGWLSSLVPAFGPGRGPGVPESSGAPGMEPASPSSCVFASLYICLS